MTEPHRRLSMPHDSQSAPPDADHGPRVKAGRHGRGRHGTSPSPQVYALPSYERARVRAKRRADTCRIGDTLIAVVMLIAVFFIQNAGRVPEGLSEFLSIRLTLKNLLLIGGFAVGWRVICTLWGLYQYRRPMSRRDETLRVLGATVSGSFIAAVFALISVTGAFGADVVIISCVATLGTMLLLRAVLRFAPYHSAPNTREVLIIGSGPRALRIYQDLSQSDTAEQRVVGFVDTVPEALETDLASRMLGRIDDLEAILMRRAIDEVIVALPVRSQYVEIQQVIQACERVGVQVRYPADVFQLTRARHAVGSSDHFTVLSMTVDPSDLRLRLKRAVDAVGATLLLIVASPLLLLIAVLIRLGSRGPVLFSQPRYGLNRRVFTMYKFRTMRADAEALQSTLEAANEADGPVFKIRNDPRVTSVGRFLRRTSMDELPQLFNVLRGDMSLVGPRPLPLRDVSLFTEAALMRRFSVIPGLTCLWQISGRSDLDFSDWIRLDLEYIDHWSLWLDFKILLLTVPAVLRGRGAS